MFDIPSAVSPASISDETPGEFISPLPAVNILSKFAARSASDGLNPEARSAIPDIGPEAMAAYCSPVVSGPPFPVNILPN